MKIFQAVYACFGSMKCFECGDVGHKHTSCVHKEQPAGSSTGEQQPVSEQQTEGSNTGNQQAAGGH